MNELQLPKTAQHRLLASAAPFEAIEIVRSRQVPRLKDYGYLRQSLIRPLPTSYRYSDCARLANRKLPIFSPFLALVLEQST
jgi:hypothetical protein